MTTRRQAKREVLRERLIDAAGRRVADRGLASLRARDVAAEAGCALGGIYTVFADLDDLILHVNARTLERMDRELVEAVGDRRAGDALKALARGYARFARENRNLWAALFDHRMADGGPSPDWLLARHAALAQHIAPPLAAMRAFARGPRHPGAQLFRRGPRHRLDEPAAAVPRIARRPPGAGAGRLRRRRRSRQREEGVRPSRPPRGVGSDDAQTAAMKRQ